jgi:eukaryotic-like serine/threonine-protein kinase
VRDDDERPTEAHDSVAAHGFDSGDEDGPTIRSIANERLDPGSDVGGYVIDGVLGQGGMGVVYSATHPVIGKRAAIKVLRPELSRSPAAVERFIMEARAVNQIGHPNIVDIFAFGRLTDGRSYYVMDLLAGESLRARLKRQHALHVSEAVTVIDEIASALIAAHDKGIIHRDLKPDNVFVVSVPGRWPEVRLLDWGLLKLTSAHSSIAGSKYRTLAGSLMGTPVYMSPEQARASDQVDYRTDIYALGVVAYELLVGEAPFRRSSSIDTLLAHQEEAVPSLGMRCPSLPDELVQLIEAMLAKEPGDRPTLAAVRAVIKRLRGTKIPTMTAAGLQIELVPTASHGAAPERPTLNLRGDGQSESDTETARTVPRIKTPPKGVLPLPAPPQSQRMVAATPNGPLPVASMPAPTPSSPSLPGQSLTSLPYQSINVTPVAPARPSGPPQGTLIGHSMPPVHRADSVPPIDPHGSMQSASVRAASQGMPKPVARTDGVRRFIVIVAAALIVSGIGILIVMLT